MKDMTLINFILDRSGSMSSFGPEVVSMFNNFLEEQKSGPDYAELSLIQFDDKYEENYIKKPIKDCQPLIYGESYFPRGWTALYDAIGRTIKKVVAEIDRLQDEDRPIRVLFVILTDGFENCSTEFRDNKTIMGMIDYQKEEYNWDFIFMGAGIDAIEQGKKFGLGSNKCASFHKSPTGIRSIGQTVSSYSMQYRTTGMCADINNYIK